MDAATFVLSQCQQQTIMLLRAVYFQLNALTAFSLFLYHCFCESYARAGTGMRAMRYMGQIRNFKSTLHGCTKHMCVCDWLTECRSLLFVLSLLCFVVCLLCTPLYVFCVGHIVKIYIWCKSSSKKTHTVSWDVFHLMSSAQECALQKEYANEDMFLIAPLL